MKFIEPWFAFALLSVFALAGAELSQKISLTHKANINPISNNFFVWIMQGIGGIVITVILREFVFSVYDVPWARLTILGVIYFAGGTFYYTSYKSNSPSLSMILVSISVAISTILGIFIFGESRLPIKFLGISLILFSIFFVNFQKRLKIDKHNLYAILGGLCFGVAFTIDKSFVLQIPASVYLSLMSFSVAVISFIVRPRLIVQEAKKMNHENYFTIVLAALFGTLFNYFTFNSYRFGGHVGIVDAINNSAVFLVILMEIFILGDRSKLLIKIIASLLTITGVFLLSLIN